jgi:hypothetical protein
VEALPGALLLTSGFALLAVLLRAVFWGIQWLDTKVPWLGTGLAAIASLFLALREVPNFVALALALCIVFRGSTPSNVRRARPIVLGRLHDAYIGVVVVLLVVAGATLFLFLSPNSGPRLRPLLGPMFDWHASGYGLLLLITGGVFLTAPLWAYAQRIPTAHVLDVSLTKLARSLAMTSLFLSVVAGPVCLLGERNLQPQLLKIFVNEPVYYLSR